MRMSCNGCRVLRKGCSENCSIRPCLQWIKSPESQANATVFLAKFYGRAGLMNLINSGPDHLRPAIFRSLLYEACGRIVNPIYGSVGLLWSGSWHLCQAAVESVLKGAPIIQIPADAAAATALPTAAAPPKAAYDIRHVSKDENSSAAAQELHKVRTRSRFKRAAAKANKGDDSAALSRLGEFTRAPSHESSASQQTELLNGEGTESVFSVETVEASLASRADHEPARKVGSCSEECDDEEDDEEISEVELELTLGLEPSSHHHHHLSRVQHVGPVIKGGDLAACKMELALDLHG
ncbi:hypothetical protein Scep_022565 [Stephania cephalantha]|uniref:LOB domain-containing protein n=1 Tax=Stephania cephalantha TaxID=152367 RepID=A0AAP0I299_9MAGN